MKGLIKGMIWSFVPDRPIYLQLQEILKLSIVSGVHPPGAKLPAVRDLAIEAAVNPNTVQRALTELEREGLVYAQRTSGRFVTEDTEVIRKMKNELAMEIVDAFLEKMSAIGYGAGEAAAMITGKAGTAAMTTTAAGTAAAAAPTAVAGVATIADAAAATGSIASPVSGKAVVAAAGVAAGEVDERREYSNGNS